MSSYIKLLKTQKTISFLLLAQLICYFGAWFLHIVFYTLLINLNAPNWAITLMAALTFLPGVIFAPITGAIVDIIPTKKLLVFILIIEIITAILLFLVDSLSWLYFLFFIVFIRMSAANVYFQATMSIFPKILGFHDLKLANELNSIVWSIAYTAGMAIAGIVVHFLGIKIAIYINIILYILGLIIILKTPIINVKNSTSKILNTMQKGFLYLKKNKLIIHLIILHASIGLTAYDALVALLAKYDYKYILSAALVIGLIDTSRAVALVIGTFSLSKYINEKNLFYFFIIQGFCVIFWAIMQFNFYTGLLGTFVAGFNTTILWSFTYTLIQNNTQKRYYGRVLAYVDMVFLLVATLTSFFIGFLFDMGFNLKIITIFIGIGFFIFGYYYKWIKSKYR